MLVSYFTLALRHLAKYKLYTTINLIGLSSGLAVFLFAYLFSGYEQNHDHMFAKRDQIFTVGSMFSVQSGEPISEYPNARLAYAPYFRQEIPEAKLIVRSIARQHLLSTNNWQAYQRIRFVEQGFTDIFDFDYLAGNKSVLTDKTHIIVTESLAKQWFNSTEVIGKKITINHQLALTIAAVIKDVAPDSHFNSSMLPGHQLSVLASIDLLAAISEFELVGEWQSLQPFDLTYFLMPKATTRQWLQQQVDKVYQQYTPDDEKAYISDLKVRPLIEANTQVWKSLRFPVFSALALLSGLILLMACVNYTNLATAQSLTRTKEIALRKALGASKYQLLLQFACESLLLTIIAMLIAISALEFACVWFNQATGKGLTLHYVELLPVALGTICVVAVLAGAYPSYAIVRQSTIDGLKLSHKQQSSVVFREVMLTIQLMIAVFIFTLVTIIYLQNNKMQALSDVFLKRPITVVDLKKVERSLPQWQTLAADIATLDDVSTLSFSQAIPFNDVDAPRRSALDPSQLNQSSQEICSIAIDRHFVDSYQIPIIAGRIEDVFHSNTNVTPVIANQLALKALGIENANQALGRQFVQQLNDNSDQIAHFVIAAVMPDQYFLGVHMKHRPIIFYPLTESPKYLSVVHTVPYLHTSDTLSEQIGQRWRKHITEAPIQQAPLYNYFNRFFRIPKMINIAFGYFAIIAIVLSGIGLFGLTAFLTNRRAKEIAMRKIMGAEQHQIVQLLIGQLAKPIIIALAISLPLAYYASDIYLSFFPERVEHIALVLISASVLTIVGAYLIVAVQVVKIAQATPIKVLRYQ